MLKPCSKIGVDDEEQEMVAKLVGGEHRADI
jgi:hypothetical protein